MNERMNTLPGYVRPAGDASCSKLLLVLILLLAGLVSSCSTASTPGSVAKFKPTMTLPRSIIGKIDEFVLPAGTLPGKIVAGPDGNLWFAALNLTPNQRLTPLIEKITPSGKVSEFSMSASSDTPSSLTRGPDGNLWFTEEQSPRIGKISISGMITEYALPDGDSSAINGYIPHGIIAGPDGNLWFTLNPITMQNRKSAKIGRITTSGTISEFLLPNNNGGAYFSLVAGLDGKIWFTEIQGTPPNAKGILASITPTGQISEIPMSLPESPSQITVGPDGNFWFSEYPAHLVGRITPNGTVTEFPLSTGSGVGDITNADGALWFSEAVGMQSNSTGKIGRITTAGEVSEFPLPTPGNEPSGLTSGSDGSLWFSESTSNGQNSKIGHLV